MIISNPEHRAIAVKIWNVPDDRIPKRPGYHTVEMFRALEPAGVRVVGALEVEGKRVLTVATDGQMLGWIALRDAVWPGVAEVIAALRQVGVHEILMLTGDNPRAAAAVATEVGVDGYHAGLLPEEKLAVVRDLQRRGLRVAVVGDGVNDAPALAAAEIGIAMGAAGTDAAIETADVALMSDDLRQLPFAIRLGRRSLRTIQANITLSLVTKAVFVLLAVLGRATLWMAVAADMGTSLVVIFNGMRLLRSRGSTVMIF